MLFEFKIWVPEQSPPNLLAYFDAVPSKTTNANLHPLTRTSILTFLAKKGVIYGIQEAIIEKILQQSFAHRELIAIGLPPLMGSDASFVFLAADQQKQYEALFKGSSRLSTHRGGLEHLMQMTVAAQTPLIQKTPPSRGAPGMDIFGMLIPGLKGQERPFPPYRNALVSSKNKNILVSAIEGLPVVDLPRYVDVFPLTVLSYDLKESAYFKGTVAIIGHVADYVRIRAYGDILVSGTVDAAVLLSGRHIWIRQGVKGKDIAVLKAKGNILLRYAERATLEAGKNIEAEAMHHCYAVALDSVRVNYILGGETIASRQLWTDIAGSPGVDTSLSCGNHSYLRAEIDLLEAELAEVEASIQFLKTELSSNIGELSQKQPILLQHYRQLLPKKEYLRQMLGFRLSVLGLIHEETRSSAIEMASGLYPDTWLKINQFEKYNHEFMSEGISFVAGRYGIVPRQQVQEPIH